MSLQPTNEMRQQRIRNLADKFKSLEVGETVTHAELGRIAGVFPVPNEMISRAHLLANSESGVHIDSVRGVGYIRRPATAWDGVASKHRKRARNQIGRGAKIVGNIGKFTNELSSEEMRRMSRELGLLDSVRAMLRRTG